MKLYTKAALAIVAAFLIFFTVAGVIKAYYVDPARRENLRATSAAGLELAARTLRQAADRDATLAQLAPLFRGRVAIEPAPGPQSAGWLERGDQTFLYRRIDPESALVLGPLPDIDPAPAIMGVVAISLALALAGGFAFFLVAPLIRRLQTLERVTRRLAAGELGARATDKQRDAIGSLARRFNQMATEIERLIQNKRELLQAVSHEFRTPASRIRFELAMLADEPEPESRERRIARIDDSLVEMDELVDELLTYVRLDGRRPELDLEPVAVTDLAREVAASLAPLRPDIELSVSGSDAIELVASRRYLKRALTNIVSNGLRHARSRLTIDAARTGDAVAIAVGDDGPGIPADSREKIFEPFARLDDSRSRAGGGAGLGLAIVARICDWHGATVEVTDSDVGARFVMTWPAAS